MRKIATLNKQINCLCVGPQRTASSWLDIAMREHPQLVLPTNVKETFFFDRYYGRGLEWYRSHFGEASEGKLWVEVGSTYFESDQARRRIWETNPDTKILILVRNPIARSFSSFGHERTKGRVDHDFFSAIRQQPRIVSSGHYRTLGPKWETTFGRGRIFYLLQEDIETDPQGQFDAICSFLGVEHAPLPNELHAKYGQGTIPKFQILAALASRMASALRRMGLHRVVKAGKKVGLKKVYSGGDHKALSITRPVYDYLAAEHESDIRFLEDRLVRSFPHWRALKTYGLESDGNE